MLKTVTSPANDRAPQVHVPATLTAGRALKPRPTNTGHRPVPRHRNAGSIDPNVGSASGELANAGAADWMAAIWPFPANGLGSRRTATRVTRGAIRLSSSSHLPQITNPNCTNPVVLPCGRARLATKPRLPGSVAWTKTIGTARVTSSKASMLLPLTATVTSDASPTNSAAYFLY